MKWTAAAEGAVQKEEEARRLKIAKKRKEDIFLTVHKNTTYYFRPAMSKITSTSFPSSSNIFESRERRRSNRLRFPLLLLPLPRDCDRETSRYFFFFFLFSLSISPYLPRYTVVDMGICFSCFSFSQSLFNVISMTAIVSLKVWVSE